MEKQKLLKILEKYDKIITDFEDRKLHENEKAKVQRNGVVYTPKKIADYMIGNILKIFFKNKSFNFDLNYINPSQEDIAAIFFAENHLMREGIFESLKNLRILDPSCGSGRFLISTANYLLNLFKLIKPNESIYKLKRKIIQNNIFGVEIDDEAFHISKIRLINWIHSDSSKNLVYKHIKTEKDLNINLNIYNTDFLLEFEPEKKFDIIIGNPPYVENKKIKDLDYKKKIVKNFKSAYKLFDLSIVFIEKSLEILNFDGFISFILTNKFLAADYGSKIRKIIINESSIEEIINISSLSIFGKTATYPIIICLKKGLVKDDYKMIIKKFTDSHNISHLSEKISYELPFSVIKKIPQNIIPISGDIELIEEVYLKFKTMAEMIDDLEIIYRPFGFLQWSKHFSNVCEEKTSDKDMILIGTGNVGKYHIIFDKRIKIAKNDLSVSYFKYNDNFQYFWQDLNKEKLIFREIAKCLTFTYDPGVFVNITGLYFLKVPSFSTDNLFCLLTILNSSLMDEVFKTLFGTLHMSGGYLRFNGSFIKRLPLPDHLPLSLSYLGKFLQFLSQIRYDFNDDIDQRIVNLTDINKFIDFFNKLSNSLVILLFSRRNIGKELSALEKILKSEDLIPDIKFNYSVARFDLKKFNSATSSELKQNLAVITRIYDELREKNLLLEMESITKFNKYN